MKLTQLHTAALIALGIVSQASAIDYVYITGSTAARNAAYDTLNSTNVFDALPVIITQGNATAKKCTYMTFKGTIGGTTNYIKCDWSGSEGGIQDLAIGSTQPFLDDTATSGTTSSGPFVNSTVDLAFADNDKAYSRNPTAAITGTKVCVIPFAFVKEKGSATNLVNVTDQQVRKALTGGVKTALITGNTNDLGYTYVSGRDNLSGTRVNAFGVTGFGIFTTPSQIEVNSSGAMIDVDASGSYAGDWGYPSGGTLATQMGYDLSASSDSIVGSGKFSVIGYLGRSDASTGVSNGGTELSYNGVFESTASVIEGQYNFWGNEYVYRKNSPTSQATTVYNKLVAVTGVNKASDGLTTIDLGLMHATRNGPTSDPFHN